MWGPTMREHVKYELENVPHAHLNENCLFVNVTLRKAFQMMGKVTFMALQKCLLMNEDQVASLTFERSE